VILQSKPPPPVEVGGFFVGAGISKGLQSLTDISHVAAHSTRPE